MVLGKILQFVAVFKSIHAARGSDMVWGTATAAYQVEGYRGADGRQPSIWDAFDTDGVSVDFPAMDPSGHPHVFAGESGQFADGDYTRYNESVSILVDGGFGMVRMSTSWSRVMTYTLDEATGDLAWRRNEAGIEHYKNVMQAYKSKGVQIALTMFHWDLPLLLEKKARLNKSSFWLSHGWATTVFGDYAQLLLSEFHPYVTWWITINEPLTLITNGYNSGSHAPGRCSDRAKCFDGDSGTEPYMAAKGMLLGHAAAFRHWEKAGRPGRGCGMTLNCDWRIPFTDSQEDKDAAERSLEWSAGIFADPMHRGEWPASMVERVGSRLPVWTESETRLVHGSHDAYFFMNTYTTNYARAAGQGNCGYSCDSATETSGYNFTSKKPIGTPSSNGWLFNYGPGMGELIAWYNKRYPGLKYVITENGWGTATSSKEDAMLDTERCNFYRDYIGNMSAIAVRERYEVAAYTAWSVMDNYEWTDGYSTRFGMVYVDYQTMERSPKMSYRWFQKYITHLKQLPTDGQPLPPCDHADFVSQNLHAPVIV
jgi:beta-glucosidase